MECQTGRYDLMCMKTKALRLEIKTTGFKTMALKTKKGIQQQGKDKY
jgi:hypothetical protein